MRKFIPILLLLAVVTSAPAATPASSKGAIAWQSWSDALFERARRENRFILLDLEAVWCHWCHVMDQETYAHPAVIKLIKSRYIPVKVDQDARPDLSRRYENYGWPATIVFNAEGQEIVKRRGFIPPQAMTALLKEIIKDPSPVTYRDSEPATQFSSNAVLNELLRAELQKRFVSTHDFKLGGLDQDHKFMDRDTVEYAMLLAKKGDPAAEKIARQTLDGALNLIDPAWGGAYQYSTHGDWKHVHFEKLMQIQAENLRIYALAYMHFLDPAYLKAGEDIHRYVKAFLTNPEGAFYVSQDADLVKGEHSEAYFALDDAGRRRLGIPAVDKHLYARENGWMIAGLAALYAASGEPKYLDDAVSAAQWIVQNRSIPGGGFTHGEVDSAGPYLEDTLAMGRAFLTLYMASGERQWLTRAEQAAGFIGKRFKGMGGYLTAQPQKSNVLKPLAQVDENISMARFVNLLDHYTGNNQYKKAAEHAMRYLATDKIALFRRTEAGILIAGIELANDPTHITVVGRKDDPQAKGLYGAALRYPSIYRRIEWWDKREGAMPNPDVQYPELAKAAAFVCTNKVCSLPVFNSQELAALADRLSK